MSGFEVRSGDLVFVDSFSGLVPAKLVAVHLVDGMFSERPMADVVITASRPGWSKGDRETVAVGQIVRRASVYVRSGQYRIRNDFVVVAP